MAQKAAQRQSKAQPASPVILFGIGNDGKPRGARFSNGQADLAVKAAAQLKLQMLRVTGPMVVELAGRLPAGRIHASGRGFIPNIRRDLYEKIVAQTTGTGGTHFAAGAAGPAKASKPAASKNGPPSLPKDWDDITAGHGVIAQDSPTDGWYECNVIQVTKDMLTMRWRDYPRERAFSRHRLSVALLYPNVPPTDDKKGIVTFDAMKPTTPESEPAKPADTAYPATWEAIDLNCLVLAKEDGPWRSWWEAIPIDKSSDVLSIRWRDFSQLPPITRRRWSLALLYPNGR